MYDVLIVGAGPAGAAAACALAGRAKICLVDRAAFPREKVCGDALSLVAIEELRAMDLSDEVMAAGAAPLSRVRVRSAKGLSFEAGLHQRGGGPEAALILARRTLDERLFRRAAGAADRAEERFRVTDLITEAGRVVGIRGSRGGPPEELRSGIVIAADGARSVAARALGLAPRRDIHYVAGLRAYFRNAPVRVGTVEFSFLPGAYAGYGWIFPLGGGVANVGVGLRLDRCRSTDRTLWRLFEEFVESRRAAGEGSPLSRAEIEKGPRAWLAPLASDRRASRSAPGCLLAGDAGATVDPLTGEGIGPAMRSGRLAAEAVLDAMGAGRFPGGVPPLYESRLKKAFRPDWRAATGAQRLLMQRPVLDLFIAWGSKSPSVAEGIARLLAGVTPKSVVTDPQWVLKKISGEVRKVT